MQITIDLPDNLTDKIPEQWGNLSQKILANLVLDAFKDGLIDFAEMKDMLNFFSETDFKEFLKQKNMLHSQGILNLYGACPDIDFVEDDLGISDDMDDDLIGVFDE
ncbi:hypothetical protein PN456_08660 [Nodularia spumigena CS-586/05]|uniref:hypothetical protein n=1 Tax=Nodularia spumigena TaxID=70799 RepID=UPI00232EA689|nr:hypothetical protein [Nodularia spumigena]MDB9344631.1 hypothetical protein [Nodularia spumigena CS-588/06]MDB9369025.1 hypothetical protein [Nodularia spumigena CS-586/05]